MRGMHCYWPHVTEDTEAGHPSALFEVTQPVTSRPGIRTQALHRAGAPGHYAELPQLKLQSREETHERGSTNASQALGETFDHANN